MLCLTGRHSLQMCSLTAAVTKESNCHELMISPCNRSQLNQSNCDAQLSSGPSMTAVCQHIAGHSRAATPAAAESWLCRVGSHAAGKSANTSGSLDASILYLYSGPTLGYVLLYYSLPIADCCKPPEPLDSATGPSPAGCWIFGYLLTGQVTYLLPLAGVHLHSSDRSAVWTMHVQQDLRWHART